MSKDDWIWVAIRIFGIYLLVLSVVTIPGVVHYAMMTHTFWHLRQFEQSLSPSLGADQKVQGTAEFVQALSEMQRETLRGSISHLASGLTRLIVFSVCGVYLLRSGALIFRLVGRTPGMDAEQVDSANPPQGSGP